MGKHLPDEYVSVLEQVKESGVPTELHSVDDKDVINIYKNLIKDEYLTGNIEAWYMNKTTLHGIALTLKGEEALLVPTNKIYRFIWQYWQWLLSFIIVGVGGLALKACL